VAAVRLARDVAVSEFANGRLSLDAIAHEMHGETGYSWVGGVWLRDVWDAIRLLSSMLVADIPDVAKHLGATTLAAAAHGPVITGAHAVFVEDGALLEPFTVFDTTLGPVLLRAGAHVLSFTRIMGPCYIGRDTTVVADRISGSAIGDTCRVHGELSASILIGHSNKGHDGFVGHSILGRWVNLGAGTTTSNLKNTYGSVALWTPDGVRDTGLQFLGTLFGDHVKTGIGLRLNTGTVLGAGTNVVDQMPPKVLAPFSWGSRTPYALYDAEKFVQTAARMMQRRNVLLSEGAKRYLHALHAARWTAS
jgi:UDP-N-acetylglucosamine diphosphorylase/glucosamine-1-phosphate N-acetyltransferase